MNEEEQERPLMVAYDARGRLRPVTIEELPPAVAYSYRGTPEEARSLAEQMLGDVQFRVEQPYTLGAGREWTEEAVEDLREQLGQRYGPHFPEALKAAIRERLG